MLTWTRQFFDLIELFKVSGMCPQENFVFLGDYVVDYTGEARQYVTLTRTAAGTRVKLSFSCSR